MHSSAQNWSSTHQTWQFGEVEFHLVLGDIFELPVESIVNSENASFTMAPPYSRTISGQLSARYGDQLQEQLYELTERTPHPLGTVLQTDGFDDYKRIYHAGHHSTDMRDGRKLSEESRAEHFKILRECVRQVLGNVGASHISSVAFPLLGTGSFNLDPWLVAYEFIDEFIQHASSHALYGKSVWLVVYDDNLFPAVVNAITQALTDRAAATTLVPPFELGVQYLDRFEQTRLRTSHPKWATWMLVQYCEHLIRYVFFQLACAHKPKILPSQVLDEGYPISFGYMRSKTYEWASSLRDQREAWVQTVSQAVYEDGKGHQRLLNINRDRNGIAHGHEFRDLQTIANDLRAFLRASNLPSLIQQNTLPDVSQLMPWTYMASTSADTSDSSDGPEIGVLERCDSGRYTYLHPTSGRKTKVSV